MHMALSTIQLEFFARRLQGRAAELRRELEEGRKRAAEEGFTRVASEVPDGEDAALADVVIDVNNAAILRDANELRSIDEALGRLSAGSYGVCLRCGKPIEFARLQAVPTARHHAACQELEDRAALGFRVPPSL
jgi:RNA polymerase-binding transcription factor DksA